MKTLRFPKLISTLQRRRDALVPPASSVQTVKAGGGLPPLFSALVFFASASALPGAVIFSGPVNIPIPTDFDGIYVDLDTGATSSTPIAGWDLNPTFGGLEIYNNETFQPVRAGTGSEDAILNLAFGAPVNAGIPSFSSGFGLSDSHTGAGTTQFTPGASGYLGFKFSDNVDNGPLYGWMKITVDGIAGGVIESWAYDNTGAALAVGTTVPEPSTYAALAGLAVLGLAYLRRR